ncbi:MAG: molybdopterin converting factor subunit 1 [Gammaproteobacteria bacterium]|jgi:sulfur-carrier protein|nr:molybdopterin converting factor subunit 1 [Gammaproteobacteria bacterium]MBT5205107.1 molybdopterin converting factor subunit 1 [Gammaproteobacteria bacterium]MBT5601376.1 molybdopterin converting factor subunit 1 [Gammaproteobacteria bacterium]MBT6246252.1 molybdopterin converting factor subunit 1 [Gammaproteobacteria bacterium]
MIKVVFFASLRERFGSSGFAVENNQVESVAGLVKLLELPDGTSFNSIFAQEKLMVAVNQEVVDGDCLITEGDEVAFFPPVTGG